MDSIIIGAGIAGLGAAFTLTQKGYRPIILEKDSTYGGLCGNFTIANGFRFDRFVHLSFSCIPEINNLFAESVKGNLIRHIPNPFNIYHGKWIKHPAQNNLYPLSDQEKSMIIADFRNRPQINDTSQISNYEEWLRLQYGNEFAQHFPIPYTTKYWMSQAHELETKWIGKRLYQPSLEEVIQGAESSETPVTYYAKEMRYPTSGGYKSFLSKLAANTDIHFNSNVTNVDTVKRTVQTADGRKYIYDRLISSMPLPLLINSLGDSVPQAVKTACSKLRCTSGYIISIALKGDDIPPYLWWYIYDTDILPARVYSPSLKSPDNAPTGCSSLQLEVYCNKDQFTREELLAQSVEPLIAMGIIKREAIIEIDIRFEPWANVIFNHDIYVSRQTVLDYVRKIGIEPIGRFGLWDYLWSDQALMSGLSIKA